MRTVHWLFVISLALFVSGVGFVIAAGRVTRSATPVAAAAQGPAVPSIATVKQIMQGMVSPASAVIWNSVATTVSAKGVEETRPETDDDWAHVGANAAVLVESANLLTMSDRAPDKGDWVTMARDMANAANKALEFAGKKDAEGILAVGEELNVTCDKCHERYSRN
jgi:hypothetical protein